MALEALLREVAGRGSTACRQCITGVSSRYRYMCLALRAAPGHDDGDRRVRRDGDVEALAVGAPDGLLGHWCLVYPLLQNDAVVLGQVRLVHHANILDEPGRDSRLHAFWILLVCRRKCVHFIGGTPRDVILLVTGLRG